MWHRSQVQGFSLSRCKTVSSCWVHSDCRCYPCPRQSSPPASPRSGTSLDQPPPPITAVYPELSRWGKWLHLYNWYPGLTAAQLSGHVTFILASHWWRESTLPTPLGVVSRVPGEGCWDLPGFFSTLSTQVTISHYRIPYRTLFNYWQIYIIALGPNPTPWAFHNPPRTYYVHTWRDICTGSGLFQRNSGCVVATCKFHAWF